MERGRGMGRDGKEGDVFCDTRKELLMASNQRHVHVHACVLYCTCMYTVHTCTCTNSRHTVDLEIFVVKIFSWLAQATKIKNTKYFIH